MYKAELPIGTLALIETNEHSLRLCKLASEFALSIGLCDSDIIDISIGCLLHDFGKFKISADILTKPGVLTTEEFEEIRKHPVYSYQMVKALGFSHNVQEICKYHHEKGGKEGYPGQLEELPYLVQIVRLCDIFDALTENRAYRKKYNRSESISIFKIEAKGCSNELVEKFVTFVKKFKENIA